MEPLGRTSVGEGSTNNGDRSLTSGVAAACNGCDGLVRKMVAAVDSEGARVFAAREGRGQAAVKGGDGCVTEANCSSPLRTPLLLFDLLSYASSSPPSQQRRAGTKAVAALSSPAAKTAALQRRWWRLVWWFWVKRWFSFCPHSSRMIVEILMWKILWMAIDLVFTSRLMEIFDVGKILQIMGLDSLHA
ncbi:hypothetical protein Droror1_Dr00027599 [Drosera rotundifolia]